MQKTNYFHVPWTINKIDFIRHRIYFKHRVYNKKKRKMITRIECEKLNQHLIEHLICDKYFTKQFLNYLRNRISIIELKDKLLIVYFYKQFLIDKYSFDQLDSIKDSTVNVFFIKTLIKNFYESNVFIKDYQEDKQFFIFKLFLKPNLIFKPVEYQTVELDKNKYQQILQTVDFFPAKNCILKQLNYITKYKLIPQDEIIEVNDINQFIEIASNINNLTFFYYKNKKQLDEFEQALINLKFKKVKDYPPNYLLNKNVNSKLKQLRIILLDTKYYRHQSNNNMVRPSADDISFPSEKIKRLVIKCLDEKNQKLTAGDKSIELFKDMNFRLLYSLKNQNCNVVANYTNLLELKGEYFFDYNGLYYIQSAVLLYFNNNNKFNEYFQIHYENGTIKNYIKNALIQKCFDFSNYDYQKCENLINEYQQKICDDIHFKIQVVARLIQHDDTGILYSNLSYKFLKDDFDKTLLSQYIDTFALFMSSLECQHNISLEVDKNNRFNIFITTDKYAKPVFLNKPLFLSLNINLERLVELSKLNVEVENNCLSILNDISNDSEHQSFENIIHDFINNEQDVINKENNNQINVISDIYANNKLTFSNANFNVFVGNIMISKLNTNPIKGIAVLGNSDIKVLLNNESMYKMWKDDVWYEFYNVDKPNNIHSHNLSVRIKEEFNKIFPNVKLLNNESYIYQGIRYIGLTIPWKIKTNKKLIDKYFYNVLVDLLDKDYSIPTVILSYSPLFSEFDTTERVHQAYSKYFRCSDVDKFSKLLNQFNIIAIIHGNNKNETTCVQSIFFYNSEPIITSGKWWKNTTLGNKNYLVLSSYYNSLNTGINLKTTINDFNWKDPLSLLEQDTNNSKIRNYN